MSFTQTYAIEDCQRYIATVNTANVNYELPSSAVISFDMIRTSMVSGTGGCNILLADSSHTYYVGNWSSYGNNGVLIRNTGSSSNLVSQTVSNLVENTDYTITLKYDNGDWEYSANTDKVTFSASYTPTKITKLDKGNGVMTNLKIKPL